MNTIGQYYLQLVKKHDSLHTRQYMQCNQGEKQRYDPAMYRNKQKVKNEVELDQ